MLLLELQNEDPIQHKIISGLANMDSIHIVFSWNVMVSFLMDGRYLHGATTSFFAVKQLFRQYVLPIVCRRRQRGAALKSEFADSELVSTYQYPSPPRHKHVFGFPLFHYYLQWLLLVTPLNSQMF